VEWRLAAIPLLSLSKKTNVILSETKCSEESHDCLIKIINLQNVSGFAIP
jgi:hypothetical protein